MKKNFYYQGVKKVLGLFLIGIIYFLTMHNVSAKTLTINEVSGKFNTSTIIDGLNQLGGNFASSIDLVNKTLDVYEGTEKVFSFTYTEDYIEYNNRNAVVTEDNVAKDIATSLFIYSIEESILELSGYKDKSFKEEETYTDTFETYGLQLETESYSFKGTNTDEGEWSMSGEYTKYFKMSLDTDKIDALMTKYGVDGTIEDPNKEVIANLIPTLKAEKVTANSVTLYPHVNYVNTDPDDLVYCHIYRSTSEDGTYERISAGAVNCLDGIGLVDEGLNSNTTYYYKALVLGGTKYSEVISVTTKGSIAPETTPSATSASTPTSANSNHEEIIENPQTGVFFPIGIVILMILGSVAIFRYVRKNTVFRKI